MTAWDWDAAARRAGAGRDGRFNCGAVPFTHPRALVWRRRDGGTVELAGAELQALAGRTASVLRRAGVRRGDRVAAQLGRRPEAFTVALAVWRLGAVYVPLFSGFGADALRVRLDDAGASAIVTDPESRPGLAEVEGGRTILVTGGHAGDGELDLDALVSSAGDDAGAADTALGDPATIMYTSGTSGRPKGCVIPHRGPIVLRPYVERCLDLRPDDLLFSTADTGWAFGLYTTGVAPLSLGCARLLVEGGFDAREWWRTMRELEVAHLASAPTGFRQLALAGEEALGAAGVPALRAATAAGEALDPDAIGWFDRTVGVRIHDSYGLTELGMLVADQRGPGSPPPRPGSMGTPLPGFAVRVVDDDGADVEPGGEGLVAVRDTGWFLSATYWGRDEDWAARLREGWWVTEDRVRLESDGTLAYVGRDDDVIVTAGYNVGPGEVEGVLVQHEAVAEAACVAGSDARKGQVVVAHVVLSRPEPAGLAAELRQLVGARLGWHAAPRRVHVRDALPRTESGKLRRRELRDEEDVT
jgi:acetyl-CoA synthetase